MKMRASKLYPVLLAGALVAIACECQAGPENRQQLKEDARAAWAKARDLAKGVATETKEFVRHGTARARVISKDVAEHSRKAAKKTRAVLKDVGATTRDVVVETKETVKDAIKDATK